MVHPRACRARNGRRFDETALLERRQLVREAANGMAVEGRTRRARAARSPGRCRAARAHPPRAPRGYGGADRGARRGGHDGRCRDSHEARRPDRGRRGPAEADPPDGPPGLSNAGRTRTRPLTKGRSAAVAAGHRADRGRITRISHRDRPTTAPKHTSGASRPARGNASAEPSETKGGEAWEGPQAAAVAAKRKTISDAAWGPRCSDAAPKRNDSQ